MTPTGPPDRPGAGGRPPGTPPPGTPGRGTPGRSHLPRPPLLSEPEDELVDRPRQRISSSPLKRLEGEEKEIERRSQPVHLGLRLTVMGVVVLGLFSMMIVRLWSLQVLQGPAALKADNATTSRVVYLTPPRGLILSRNGDVLVANKVMPVVTLNRQDAADDPGLVERVAVVLDMTTATINADLADQQDSIYEPVPVAVGVSPATILTISEDAAQLPGVTVSYVAERTYPDKDLGVQMLGYVSDINGGQLKALAKEGYLASDVIGQAGVEQQYESFLRGKPGKDVFQVDALGDPVGSPAETPATPGDDVVLNVDEGLEAEVEKALSDQLSTLNASGLSATSGAAVVIDPQNGAVLAMVSLPQYDPEWWVGGMSTAHWNELNTKSAHDPQLNRVVEGVYQPGSTFKLVTATAALQDGVISPYTMISDPGYFTIPNCSGDCQFHNNDYESCGSCNVTTAITMSDDVFFYTMGYDFYAGIGTSDHVGIQQYAAAYGLGEATDVDLPGGNSAGYTQVDGPQLRAEQHKLDPKAFPYTYYGPGDALETAFGQGETLVSPLQLADAYATFANGGTRYAPQVAAAVLSPTGKVLKVFKPKVEGHVAISQANYLAMLQGFEGVITKSNGTAYSTFQGYRYSQLPIAGKTGTATTSANPSAQPTADFVAFGPVSTSGIDTSLPQYCVVAVIPGAGYGASAAAPVVRAIFQYLMKHPVHAVDLHPKLPAG